MTYTTTSEKTPTPSTVQNLHPDSAKLDCKALLALGVSPDDARMIMEILEISNLAKQYRHQLYRQGVVKEDARRLAKAIAQYDVVGKIPTPPYQNLIRHYCSTICRLGLWRSQLLLPAPTAPEQPPAYRRYSYNF
ncbi:MAG: hypothetical protein VKK04_24660 [Synechococcales bacterium]|nr:hypothetical protein [Synechococcales bacterium]